jgi:hypothetical protein
MEKAKRMHKILCGGALYCALGAMRCTPTDYPALFALTHEVYHG